MLILVGAGVKFPHYLPAPSQSSRPYNSQFSKNEYLVWRRYRDFEWLQAQLEKSHPTLIIPVRMTDTITIIVLIAITRW